MNDIMIDLETWGVEPGCAIRSIGCVMFDLEGPEDEPMGSTFYCNVDLGSCLRQGLYTDEATEKWWEAQDPAVKAALETPAPIDVQYAILQLIDWINVGGASGCRVWSHGAGFDLPILRDIGRRLGLKMPWHYQKERDTRTMLMMAYQADRIWFEQHIKTVSYGRQHHALDDAMTQAKQMQRCWAVTI